MIKFVADTMIGLGLSEENIKRLKKGSPIMIKASALKIERDIFICYGKTELDILSHLKQIGLVNEKTEIKTDNTNS